MRKNNSLNFFKGIFFISPWLVGFLIFTLLPFIASFYYTFTRFSITTKVQWTGTENYVNMFSDPLFFKSLMNTVWMTVGLVPIGLL
ncbi:MAG TPA: hypothetical protein PLM73_08430, partial [Petrotogaceae bacterium]|nr:hypothetical protein [Petrotogaceae bacterium]